MRSKILLVVLLLVSSSVLIPNLVLAKRNSDSSTENNVKKYDIEKNCAAPTNLAQRPNPEQYLTYFNCGHVSVLKNGTTLRQFSLVISENHKLPITLGNGPKNPPILFPAWTFNDTIPGPTMRMTEGDHVSITVINRGTMPHSLHMHSIHQGSVDGVSLFSGGSGLIQPGKSFTYDFIAAPFGVYPYHCHVSPVVEHINRGLYGAMIIDPPKPRPEAKEMVFYLNGYDLKINDPYPRLPTTEEANQMMVNASKVDLPEEHDNSVYSMNGIAFYYKEHPINLTTGQLYRAYVVNMLDFERNSIHIHGNLYDYYPSGTGLTPAFRNDIVSFAQGDRGVMEFKYPYAGEFIMHAHTDQIASRGWLSVLHVTGPDAPSAVMSEDNSNKK
jgi:FtsP/CotA-like multicopper oxidase with cupredoxin domain